MQWAKTLIEQKVALPQEMLTIKPSNHQTIKAKAARGSAGAPCLTRHEPPGWSNKR
jgi:hypothetical protein